MADTTGTELSYGKSSDRQPAALEAGRDEHCVAESMVGVLLPASVGGALANIALLLAGKIPVNLNFTAGSEAMDAAVEQCAIKTIITSRVFLAKAEHRTEMAGMVFSRRFAKLLRRSQKFGR